MVPNSRTTSRIGLFHTGTKSFKTLCRLHWRPLLVLLVAGFFLHAPIGEAVAQICVQPPSGLVSWWPGDGHAGDVISDNHGLLLPLVGGATFVPGMVGQAFSFDGVNDFVSIADPGPGSALDLVNTDFTIDFWLKTTDPEALYLKKYPGTGGAGWAIGQTIVNLGNQLC